MEDVFQMFVALPTDDVCTLRNLTNNLRIYQLKSRVELKTGIPGDILHLHYMNRELYDDYTLKDYKLKQGCIVRVKLDSNWADLFDSCWRGDIYEVFQNGVQFLNKKEFQDYNIALWNRLVIQRATHALFIASHRGYLGLIIELINHSATDINGKTRFGRTALHVASYQGFVGCVSLLLSEGSLCNQVDFNGKTALALASENGHVYCERRLWLYHLSLKAYQNGSRRNSEADSRDSQETMESSNGRLTQRSAAKVFTFQGKQRTRLNEEEGRVENKTIHLHLPRVQTSDAQHTSSSSPGTVLQEHPRRSQFPLVQIAEKYRKELQDYNESNIPHVDEKHRIGQHRPNTAPDLARLEKVEKQPGHKDAVEQVRNANNLPEEAQKDKSKKNTTDEKHMQGLEPVTTSIQETSNDSRDNKSATEQSGTESLPQSSDNRKNTQRPSTAKPNPIRRLDAVMSSSWEKRIDVHLSTMHEHSSTKHNTEDSPSNPEVFVDVTEYSYMRRKPAQTFENWLEMKRNNGKLRPTTAPAPEKSKVGKSIDPDAFKEWLNRKRHNHYRSFSDSSDSGSKKSYISSGLTFDQWLETKSKATSAGKENINHPSESNDNGGKISKKVRVVLAGKTYEDWLNEKLKQVHATLNSDNTEGGRNAPKCGKTFEMWSLDKRKQKQIEAIHKATTEKEEQKRVEFEQYQKYLDPHYKTFDEWLAIKRQEHLLERFRAENEPKREDIPKDEKKKDADLVFDIWLTMKYVQEIKAEEEKYQEMKVKWETKERLRAQLRRAVLFNKLKRNFNKSCETTERAPDAEGSESQTNV